MIMGKAKESTVTVKLPASLVEQISELNEVDPKYVERTIARILRDEIAVEKKFGICRAPRTPSRTRRPDSKNQVTVEYEDHTARPADLKNIDRTGRFCGAFQV